MEIKFSYKNQIIISWQNYNWTDNNDNYDENDDEDKYKKKEGNAYFLAVCQKMISIPFSMSSRTKEKDAGMIRKIMAKYTGSNESSNVRDDAKNYKNTWGFSNIIYTHKKARGVHPWKFNETDKRDINYAVYFKNIIWNDDDKMTFSAMQWIEGTWVVYGSFLNVEIERWWKKDIIQGDITLKELFFSSGVKVDMSRFLLKIQDLNSMISCLF